MRALSALACAVFLSLASIPASAYGPGTGSRCALSPGRAVLPSPIALGKCRRPAPAGWGFYMRQRLRDDESAPLAIYDELGGVTLYRDRR
jgi:hypothetical protein